MIVRYSKRALRDLEQIAAYTRKLSPKGAARVGSRIKSRIDALLQFPDQGSPAGELRMIVVTRTPYIVVYRVTSDIEILTIVHHARKRRD